MASGKAIHGLGLFLEHDYLKTLNLLIKQLDANTIAIRNAVDDAFRDLKLRKLMTTEDAQIGPETSGIASEFLKIGPTGAYGRIISAYGTSPTGELQFNVYNTAVPSINNLCTMAFRCNSSTQMRAVGTFQGRFTVTNDATRMSEFIIKGADNGVWSEIIKCVGKEVTIPDLADVGDAYVYVDANGKLCRGVAYP